MYRLMIEIVLVDSDGVPVNPIEKKPSAIGEQVVGTIYLNKDELIKKALERVTEEPC